MKRLMMLVAALVLLATVSFGASRIFQSHGTAASCRAWGEATLLGKKYTGDVVYQYNQARGCIVSTRWPTRALARHKVGTCIVPTDPFAQCWHRDGGGASW